MKLKNTLALSLAAVMAAGLTACGSGADTASAASPAADSTAAESTEAAADTAAPDGDGDPTTLTVAMEWRLRPLQLDPERRCQQRCGDSRLQRLRLRLRCHDGQEDRRGAGPEGPDRQAGLGQPDSRRHERRRGLRHCRSVHHGGARRAGRFQRPVLLCLHRHPDEEGQRLCQCCKCG